MIDGSNTNAYKYETGMRATELFLNMGPDPIRYEFDLPIVHYGNDKTQSDARRIANKVVFN
jgi:hypothetical protein